MAKKSSIAKNKKQKKLYKRYKKRREELKKAILDPEISGEEQQQLIAEMNKMPRNSSKARQALICSITGRRRGVNRRTGLSRHVLKRLALEGKIPGVKKASW